MSFIIHHKSNRKEYSNDYEFYANRALALTVGNTGGVTLII